ncbi:unnamed protein product [Penicillium olsonii]|nr:unnamed protein product [Penicillium olsonii]
MLRHASKHKLPEYVCPFCPDGRRIYQRADTLSRYSWASSTIHASSKLTVADMSESATPISPAMIPSSERLSRENKLGVQLADQE